jgi:hypothetical protein
MKRIETLVKLAMVELVQEYNFAPVNGVSIMELARAVDKIREGERVLREAFEGSDRR